ncbi:hypothetical protein E6O75_ATG07155 [Venturia nashicola]|uniref:Uncharacterized protein n=1 Tax=Venturia nashicola TaxID=86259 RepID=A0A4Z1NTD2_9PEZI|nr:hypothetical protein E6O75_ATG07155 [Venturia nashicola]
MKKACTQYIQRFTRQSPRLIVLTYYRTVGNGHYAEEVRFSTTGWQLGVDKFQAILTSKLSSIVCADLEDNLTTQSHRTNSDLILSTSFTTHPESPFPSQDAYLPPSVREVTTRDISQQ